MEERQRQALGQRWEQYRPSKSVLFWSCAATAIATVVIGFSWGGWVTGSTAREMAEASAQDAHRELAAAVCADRFANAPEARAHLAELKEITSSYQRSKYIEDGGWAIMPGASGADRQLKAACSDILSTLELPPFEEASEISEGATIVH
jgi:hypothetical protein